MHIAAKSTFQPNIFSKFSILSEFHSEFTIDIQPTLILYSRQAKKGSADTTGPVNKII